MARIRMVKEWEINGFLFAKGKDLNLLYQVCVFRASLKYKMAAMASNWLRHFQLLC